MLALLILVGMGHPQAQPVFRASTEVVPVDVFVGKDGKALTGLSRDAFTLYDNGYERDIELIDVTTVPLDVAIVLDASASVSGPKLESLRSGVRAFSDELADDDRAALITFAQHLGYPARLSSDRGELWRAVDAVRAAGATAWHDALFAGLKVVETASHRPAVVLFSDGVDTYSFLLEEQLLPLIEQSHAVLYAVTPATKRPPSGTAFSAERKTWRAFREQREEHTRLLRTLTAASGGRLLETESIGELEASFVEILTELKTRYLLTFTPTHPIERGWHEIEVEVNVPGAEVRARRGYFYE